MICDMVELIFFLKVLYGEPIDIRNESPFKRHSDIKKN